MEVTTKQGWRVVTHKHVEAVQTYAPWRPSLEIYRVYIRGTATGDLMADPVAGWNYVPTRGGAVVPFRTVTEAIAKLATLR